MPDTRRFVDPVAQSFLCGICYEVLRNPVSGCKEGHCFCLDCIKKVDKCPMCRASYINGFVKSRPAEDYIQSLTVLCKHGPQPGSSRSGPGAHGPCAHEEPRPVAHNLTSAFIREDDESRAGHEKSDTDNTVANDSCPWRGPLSDLERHLNTNCLFEYTSCKFTASGCPAKMPRRLMAKHEEECDYRPRPCVHCKRDIPYCELEKHTEACEEAVVNCLFCNVRQRRGSLEAHTLHSCPEAEISCEYAAAGCKEKMKRKDADKHMNDHAACHMSLLAAAMAAYGRERDEKKAADMRVQEMEEEVKRLRMVNGGTVYITWKLTADTVMRELPPLPPGVSKLKLHGEWSEADRYGIRWRLILERSREFPQRVGVCLRPERVPAQEKSYDLLLKRPFVRRIGTHRWNDMHSIVCGRFVDYADLVSAQDIEFEARVQDVEVAWPMVLLAILSVSVCLLLCCLLYVCVFPICAPCAAGPQNREL